MVALTTLTTLSANAQVMDFTKKSTNNEATKANAVMVAPTETSESGVTFNSLDSDMELLRIDEEYTSTTDFVRFYADKSHVAVGSHPRPLLLQWQQTNGFFVDLRGGVSFFDGHIEPVGGLAFGYQGRWYQVDLTVNAQRNHHTMESDRPGQEFFSFNTYVSLKAKLLDLGNHHFQVWAGPRLGYVFNNDYHETPLGTTVQETETEIITTKHTSIVDVKASTLGFDPVELQLVYKPRWSCVQVVMQGSYGWQQRFYQDGNKWLSNWNVSAGIRLNLLGMKRHTNNHLVKSLGLSKQDLEAARRAK